MGLMFYGTDFTYRMNGNSIIGKSELIGNAHCEEFDVDSLQDLNFYMLVESCYYTLWQVKKPEFTNKQQYGVSGNYNKLIMASTTLVVFISKAKKIIIEIIIAIIIKRT